LALLIKLAPQKISKTIHVGASPLTMAGWRAILESEGFTVNEMAKAPMHLSGFIMVGVK
jgi:hypothetical protein